MNDKNFAYGDAAIEWLDFALRDMKRRTGWEFSEDMVEFLESLVSDCGLCVDSPNDLRLFTDNAYVNLDWGHFGDGSYEGLETEEDYVAAYEQGAITYYNTETKLYVI